LSITDVEHHGRGFTEAPPSNVAGEALVRLSSGRDLHLLAGNVVEDGIPDFRSRIGVLLLLQSLPKGCLDTFGSIAARGRGLERKRVLVDAECASRQVP